MGDDKSTAEDGGEVTVTIDKLIVRANRQDPMVSETWPSRQPFCRLPIFQDARISHYQHVDRLDTTGKMLESIILSKLSKYSETTGSLSKQFLFPKDKVMMAAILSANKTAGIALQRKR